MTNEEQQIHELINRMTEDFLKQVEPLYNRLAFLEAMKMPKIVVTREGNILREDDNERT